MLASGHVAAGLFLEPTVAAALLSPPRPRGAATGTEGEDTAADTGGGGLAATPPLTGPLAAAAAAATAAPAAAAAFALAWHGWAYHDDQDSDEAIPEGAPDKWGAQLAEAMAVQRRLQSALPPHDDNASWQNCWAQIKAHEAEGLDPVCMG
jgi:hypothetical protein